MSQNASHHPWPTDLTVVDQQQKMRYGWANERQKRTARPSRASRLSRSSRACGKADPTRAHADIQAAGHKHEWACLRSQRPALCTCLGPQTSTARSTLLLRLRESNHRSRLEANVKVTRHFRFARGHSRNQVAHRHKSWLRDDDAYSSRSSYRRGQESHPSPLRRDGISDPPTPLASLTLLSVGPR